MPTLLCDAPTCAKDVVYFLSDSGRLTGDTEDDLVAVCDEELRRSGVPTFDDSESLLAALGYLVDKVERSGVAARRQTKRKQTRAAQRKNRRR